MKKNVLQYIETVKKDRHISSLNSFGYEKLAKSPYEAPEIKAVAKALHVSVEDIMTNGGESFHRFEESIPNDRYCGFIVGNKAETYEEIEQLNEIKTCGYYRDAMLLIPNSGEASNKFCLADEFFESIARDDRVSEAAFDYLLQPYETRTAAGVWYTGFPYMIHWCYLYRNTGRLNKLIAATERNNSDAISRLDSMGLRENSGNGMGYHNTVYKINGRYGVVRIMAPTILIAIERGDVEIAERFNKINSEIPTVGGIGGPYVVSEQELYLMRVKFDKTLSEEDRMVAECVCNGVLNVDQLLKKTSDYDVVRTALDKYPITRRELIEKYINSGDWRWLFRYSFTIDNPYLSRGQLIDCAIAEDGHGYLNKYDEAWRRLYSQRPGFYGRRCELPVKSREDILNELALKAKLSETTDSLTPEYFDKQLSLGNYDMIIIKLCVRLESVLKYKYKYEGDFSEMLDAYCKKIGGGETSSLLNKLRMCRNAIVHPDQTSKTMNIDELRKCVKYICNLG